MAQVDSRSVMTCVIFWGESQPFAIDLERTVLTYESF